MQHPTSPYARPRRHSRSLSWFLMRQHLKGLRSQPGPIGRVPLRGVPEDATDRPKRPLSSRVGCIMLLIGLSLAPGSMEAAALQPLPHPPWMAAWAPDDAPAELPPRGSASTSTGTPESAVEAGRRMTLALRVDSVDGRPARWNRSVGSAVAVAYEPRQRRLWLATSAHVVPCRAGCRILVDLPTEDGRTVTGRARIQWQDSHQDLALLSTHLPEKGHVQLAHRPRHGAATPPSRVVALGYPGTDHASKSKERALEITQGAVVERHEAQRLVFRSSSADEVQGTFHLDQLIFHTAAIAPGSSGGPLLDADGALLGIHTGSLVKRQGGGCLRASDDGACLHLAVGLEALWEELERLTEPVTP